MKVWFGCTTHKWKLYRKQYFSIRNYLQKLDCIVLYDWIHEADDFIKKHKGEKRNIKYVYKQILEAINQADALVIEYTVPNFSSSHQINLGLLRRKPTLVLRLHKDNENFADSYLEAVDSQYLTVKEYTKTTYKDILKEFIGLSRIKRGQKRYNFVLDRKQKYYLDWAAHKYKKSRSRIVRETLNKRIKKDKKYRKYIID
jgi:hypothetical protein